MGDDLGTKNLVGRCARNPWKAIMGRLPPNYQIPEVGTELIHQVDRALFERKLDDAVTAGVILKKWSERDPHFYCKAPAVMSSVYSVCGATAEAERMIAKASKRINPNCDDCKAHFFKRSGTFYFHQWDYKQARVAYDTSAKLFLALNQPEDAVSSILNRGVAKYLMKEYDAALADEEFALTLLDGEFSMYTIMASINIASILVAKDEIDRAIDRIELIQEMLLGEDDLERPKLILRWIRAHLLEAQNDLKTAGEIIDRIEPRMRKLDMKPELKVLLADRARMARQPGAIQAIARKALELEDVQRIKHLIEKVLRQPTHANVLKWRNELDSYVPPFPSTV